MTNNEITFPLETIFAVDDVDEFARWTNIRLDKIFPKNSFSKYANLMLPENDPRVDENDDWERLRVANAAINESKNYSLKLERGAGNTGVFSLKCKTLDFKKHYDWLLAECRLYGWLKEQPVSEQAGDEALKNKLMELYPREWTTALDIIKLDRNEPDLPRWRQANKLNIGIDAYEGWITRLSKENLIRKRRKT